MKYIFLTTGRRFGKSHFQKLLTIHFGLRGKEKAEWHLIQRYWEKASPRLKARAALLEKLAVQGQQELLKEALSQTSFMDELPKTEPWIWGTLEIPT